MKTMVRPSLARSSFSSSRMCACVDKPRIKRRLRILKDHLDTRTQRPQLGLVELPDLDIVELDTAGGRLEQPHQEPAERGLARAGFADEAKHRAARHGEVDALDHLAQGRSPK